MSLVDQDIAMIGDLLQAERWRSVRRAADWLLRAMDEDGNMPVVVATEAKYEEKAIARSKEEALPYGTKYKTLAVEDVLIFKLITNCFQDNANVESILRTRPSINLEYVAKWLNEFEVWDRLKRIERIAINDGRLDSGISETLRLI